MPAKITDFPDICETIYEERTSLAGIYSRYIDKLRSTDNMSNILYANKLEEARNILNPLKLQELEQEIYEFKKYLRNYSTQHNIGINIKYRQKDFIRYNDKIRSNIIKGYSLDKIRDLLGFRIILITPTQDSEKTIELCYQALEEFVDFFIKERHAIPLEAENRRNSTIKDPKYPNLVIPETVKNIQSCLKDYIMFPKDNGYQSIHIVIREPNGLTFELQIRTFAMDIMAEKGNAGHHIYEQTRQEKSDICLDYSKINIPGFEYLPSGEIHDAIGLTKSIDPFNSL